MTTVSVTLPETKYEVLIERGLLKQVGELVSNQWSARKIALVSDSNVAPLYQASVAASLNQRGLECRYVFPAGEHQNH